MKYKIERIEVKNPEDLKGWDKCCYCKNQLEYKFGECKCKTCKIEFVFYFIKSLEK
jgi:hypothetical protein